uniref:Uncharacterized protein n=1 Tax=Micrurus carvalhoi TaxID=3147026 RepID=A0A2H6N077_9SAUR
MRYKGTRQTIEFENGLDLAEWELWETLLPISPNRQTVRHRLRMLPCPSILRSFPSDHMTKNGAAATFTLSHLLLGHMIQNGAVTFSILSFLPPGHVTRMELSFILSPVLSLGHMIQSGMLGPPF